MYKSLIIILAILFCSCDQVLNSIAKEAATESRNKDSMQFSYNEKPIATDKLDVVERKKIGQDSFYLVRSYFLSGEKYYDSWYKNDMPHGLTVFYFPSKKIQYTLEYKNGLAFSLINSFDEKGEKNDGGNLKNGTGTLKIYHPITGNLIYHTIYKDGLRHGKYLSYYSDGKKQDEMTFKNDTVMGPYVGYFHSGQIMRKGNLNLSISTGVQEEFYEGGKQKKYDKWENGIQKKYKEYDENGYLVNEKETIDHKLIGTKYYYNNEGVMLSKGQTYNDKKHGIYEYYYSNGKKKSHELYRSDTILTETVWYENGKISAESVYKDGLKTGVYKEYYPTGKIKLEQTYVAGIKEGPYKSYFNNGNVYNIGNFKDDELIGELKFYSENGKLKGVKQYK